MKIIDASDELHCDGCDELHQSTSARTIERQHAIYFLGRFCDGCVVFPVERYTQNLERAREDWQKQETP